MSIWKIFQKLKWEALAKLNPNYYVFSEVDSQNEGKYRQSGKRDFERYISSDEGLSSFLKNSRGKTCFEFGCGNGRMTEFLAHVFNLVWVIDISSEMIKLAKKRLSRFKNVKYLKDGEERINLEDNSIDFIFSYAVLQHLPNKRMVENVLKEFYRIIKKGGLIKIQVRGKESHGGIFRFLKWYYGVSFSGREIRNILDKIGFKIISIKGEGTKLLWLITTKK
jgi:ubiquinone/menaquinone biosynthesis C-methylase UbiE